MRRRTLAIFALLAAVVGGLLTGPAPAFAAVDFPPVCTFAAGQLNTGEVTCRVATNIGDRTVTSIDWTVNGANVAQFKNFPQITVGCSSGQVLIGHTLTFSNGETGAGTRVTTCQNRTASITSFTCGPLPRGTGYILCEAVWTGGVDPVTADWSSPRARRQPVVTTDPIARRTTAAFDCNNPGGPDLTFTTLVTVTDAVGSRASVSTIPCGW
ncbi:hypothetical protein [Planobispora takensis]|uniref:Ig-like domain-containing protein n=1 Tax=Planobispora takensis TaxID=1367882 RepID=A0A8J3T092_9ACTN|nr:hypothetical protein [Planobispora takensis]GII03707.1 hypothetical protein Pta02_57150 [Planobispora takensis]